MKKLRIGKSNLSVKTLTNEEVLMVSSYLQERDLWFYHYFMFALHTGMRRSEILALTWHDIDLWNDQVISVPDPKRPRYRDPDTRKVDIDEFLLSLLLNLRSSSRWVFQVTGKRRLGGEVAVFFSRLARELSIPLGSERIRWTYAYHLYQKIKPMKKKDWLEIQCKLGHRDLSTTKNYYQRNLSSNEINS